jgi:hypothetical protein
MQNRHGFKENMGMAKIFSFIYDPIHVLAQGIFIIIIMAASMIIDRSILFAYYMHQGLIEVITYHIIVRHIGCPSLSSEGVPQLHRVVLTTRHKATLHMGENKWSSALYMCNVLTMIIILLYY